MSGVAGRAAVLGLGIIGSRARARLAEAGWQVRSWNRTPKGLTEEQATPEAAVEGVPLVSIYLKDAPAVRAVFGRIAPVLAAGQTVLNHSTVDLATTLWLADRCDDLGCRFLDAPFTGSKVASGAGQLVYYLGGEAALAAEMEPFLRLTARKTMLCGGIGAATVVKLATNLVSACSVQALAEGMAIAGAHGVPAACFADAVAENACASVLSAMKLPAMAAGDFDPHFSLDNMAKDGRYALGLAADAGLETPAIAAVSKRMDELAADGLGGLDYSALAKPYLQPGT
jgi:3-hydroxyisobutyrate dehydrogenase/glyoxylate/succinic semialdehyde reductase